MLDPDRAIAFTHESDGQNPPGGRDSGRVLYMGVARPREPLKSKTRSQKLF